MEGREAQGFELFSQDCNQPLAGQIFVISDLTGETATAVARAAVRQFPAINLGVRRFRDVRSQEKVRELCDMAAREGALVAITLVNMELRRLMVELCKERAVPLVDLFGPLLDGMSQRFGACPTGAGDQSYTQDEEAFRRLKAVEFTAHCDDGANLELLGQADVVILGVSRTCKTPLSMYLANKGVRAANIPLVPELETPLQLWTVPRSKIVGLTIQPQWLKKVRCDRIAMMGLNPEKAAYAADQRVLVELEHARNLYAQLGAKVIDVTGRALEETAQEILEYLKELC